MADNMADAVTLDMDDLRAVAAYALDCAEGVLAIYERWEPAEARPRAALDAARAFAQGGRRTKALRDVALAALKAAGEARNEAASQAAWAAMSAAAAASLHPLAQASQVKHILGAAAHAARAAELEAGDLATVGDAQIAAAARRASPLLVDILRRYPMAPAGGGRVGELVRMLDLRLRGPS